MVDFEALGEVPKAKLRQAAPHTIRLRTAPAKADTLLPEDHHYQACMHPSLALQMCLHTPYLQHRKAGLPAGSQVKG